MKHGKQEKTFLLLLLYMIVLAHNCIAHQYDCEILNIKSLITKMLPNPPTGISNKDMHFNILSDNVTSGIKKHNPVTQDVYLARYTIFLPHPVLIRRYKPTLGFHFPKQAYTRFSLRSPPLA